MNQILLNNQLSLVKNEIKNLKDFRMKNRVFLMECSLFQPVEEWSESQQTKSCC